MDKLKMHTSNQADENYKQLLVMIWKASRVLSVQLTKMY